MTEANDTWFFCFSLCFGLFQNKYLITSLCSQAVQKEMYGITILESVLFCSKWITSKWQVAVVSKNGKATSPPGFSQLWSNFSRYSPSLLIYSTCYLEYKWLEMILDNNSRSCHASKVF